MLENLNRATLTDALFYKSEEGRPNRKRGKHQQEVNNQSAKQTIKQAKALFVEPGSGAWQARSDVDPTRSVQNPRSFQER